MDVGGAFSGFASVLATLVQMSRVARLRTAIEANVKLYEALMGRPNLEEAAQPLAHLIEHEVKQLHQLGTEPPTERDPAGGFVGLVFTVILGLPLIWLIPPDGRWWAWLLIPLDILLVILVFGVAVSTWRSPPKRS
ncbi:MAG: hypothetical protein ACRDTQ_17920 [Micromonosporaceae bacterium]